MEDNSKTFLTLEGRVFNSEGERRMKRTARATAVQLCHILLLPVTLLNNCVRNFQSAKKMKGESFG